MPAKQKPARNRRKTDKFKQNYGMTRKEWSKYKKEKPEEAHTLRVKVAERLHKALRAIK